MHLTDINHTYPIFVGSYSTCNEQQYRNPH